MKVSACMKALELAGRIILENGGETYRAEDTVLRMAQALGFAAADTFAIPSGLFISVTDEAGETHTSVSRIRLRGTNLERVDRVNHLSRRLAEGSLTLDELLPRLRQAARIGEDTAWYYAPLTAALTAAGFTIMFGGGVWEVLLGALCGALTQLVPRLLRGRDQLGMVGTLLGGILCAFVPMCIHALSGRVNTEAVIAGAIMPLVPGLSMTNAVQDILRGDMMSGVAHCARAVMVAVMVAGGAVVGTHLFESTGLAAGQAVAAVQAGFWLQLALAFAGSFVGSLGFALLLHAPGKSLVLGSAIGALGYTCYWLALHFGWAETTAMFLGALVASLGAQLAARKKRMIVTIFITVAILPLVPGLGLYRAMHALALGSIAQGGAVAMHTMALIMMIALGIGLGSALRAPQRKRKEGSA